MGTGRDARRTPSDRRIVTARWIAVAATLAIAAAAPLADLAAASPRRLPRLPAAEPAPPPMLRLGGPILLEEGFEGVDFPPTGWTLSGNPAVPDSARWKATAEPAEVRVGSGAARVRWQSYRTQDERLDTARLDLAGFPPQDLRLSFWYRTDPLFAGPFNFLVHASSDSVTWPTLWQLTDSTAAGWAWRHRMVDLSGWAGGDLWLRFRYFGRDGADLALDDVTVGYLDAPAPPENDDCAGALSSPEFVIGPAAGPFTVTGRNLWATADYPLPDAGTSCTGSTCAGRDLVWRVFVPGRHRFVATMTTAGDWDDSLFLVQSCADPAGTCVAGDRQIPDGSTVDWANDSDVETVLWLIASAWDQGSGDFEISGSIEPIVAIDPTSWGRVKSLWRAEGEGRSESAEGGGS